MKIAFVSQPWNSVVPPVQSGSVAIWTYEVARRLGESHDVTIYARRRGRQCKDEFAEGVRYRRVNAAFDGRLLKLLKKVCGSGAPGRPHHARLYAHLEYAIRVAVDIRRRRCDLVQVFNISQFIPIIRALNPRVKIVLRMSCEWLVRLDRALIARRLRQADCVFGCSEYITSGIRERFPEFADRCATILNGRDVNRFAPSDSAEDGKNTSVKQLLFIGRISPEKGVHVLVDAFGIVARRMPDVRLTVVGPDGAAPAEYFGGLNREPRMVALAPLFSTDYGAFVRARVSPDVADRVKFVGFVPHYELAELYRAADVLVFPSLEEAAGNPLIEAMAAGVPIVSTRTGGIPEYVDDGQTGILAEPADAQSLADAIMRLLQDENLRRTMGAAGRQRAVGRFSCEHLARNVLSQYMAVVHR